ncbi:hypothetical protein [Paracoccus seriniphilus]|uniref:Colicin import membrane protein n=1 Tax=Paracoccus seriniphilus TaxID=184748 RepID=A0A239Q1X5_9RHOB|nr:hypothetical protein [Paracoccus seriniphilus]WCR14564.1 protein TolA [Paracoccus seriniphilus]SNT76599.1 colicin import membrane protein [Paracoccus seriniphilus]
MEEREGRIGYWISGAAHVALILWALLGGVLFRPQPSVPVRTTEVSTMSGAEFEAYAAAARGSGPVSPEATAVASIPQPATETDAGTMPETSDTPDVQDSAQELAQPDAPEAKPDLSDFSSQPRIEVTSSLPSAPAAPEIEEAAPPVPQGVSAPQTAPQPAQPSAAPQDQVAPPVPPRSALALDSSALPQPRPADLVEARNERLAARAAAEAEAAEEAQRAAERQAAAEAEAEAERQAAAARAEEERAEQARQQAEAAERAAEAERQAAREAERQRAAEAERRAAEQAEQEAARKRAEEERLEAERRAEAARQAEAERQAAEQAEQEAARQRAEEERLEAERQAAADRQALEDALREAQQDSDATTTVGETASGNRQRIEGGSDASVAQDPLSAALSEAMSATQAPPQESAREPAPDPLQLTPVPITPTPLPDPEEHSDAGLDNLGAAPLGQPLSLSERDGFRTAIGQCWNVGALSLEAARMSISVEFRMGPDGRPDANSLRLVDLRGGSKHAAQNAFDVARRAILMCGRNGYPLPAEKYGRWQEVIVDFRPEGIGFN